jgi:uncharacterized protein YdeI (BOF family)
MKKYIFSVLMAAMAVFTFSSCEDVPAPYGTPNQPSTPDTPEVSTDGTEANPYTVTDAKTVGSGTGVFVKGYIVGFIPDKSLSEAVFSTEKAVNLNVIIAASADETDVNKCMPVQLPAGDIRTAVNLKDNAANLGQEVLLCGNIESYFGAIGVKSTSYAKIGSKEVGKKPGSTTPETPSTGKGSASEPYTIAEAITAIKAGAPSYEVYVKGTISKVTYYNATYKSLSYNLVDAGATDVLEVFSGKGLNGADFAAKEDLKVGQVVVVKGIIKAFTKNESTIYEIDKNSTIISIEGEGTVTPTPDPTPDTGDGMTATAITNNKQGTVVLTSNGYGEQKTDNEASWYTWTYDGVTYKAAKLCISAGTNGQGLQLQGEASDVAKQGFLFNSTEFAKEIKTITLYLSTKATSTFAPSYSLYAAKTANGRDTQVKGTSTNATDGDWKTYTEVYDLSSYNTKFFTLLNNTKGAVYIEKIEVTLK